MIFSPQGLVFKAQFFHSRFLKDLPVLSSLLGNSKCLIHWALQASKCETGTFLINKMSSYLYLHLSLSLYIYLEGYY